MSKKKYLPAGLLTVAALLIIGLFVYSSGQNEDKEKQETGTAAADPTEEERMWEEASVRRESGRTGRPRRRWCPLSAGITGSPFPWRPLRLPVM